MPLSQHCFAPVRWLVDDPNNATALSDLAFALHFSGSFAWADDPAAAFARSGEVARRAVASDDKDAAAHAMAAMDELFSGRHGDAIRRLRRAIELDPNSSFAHGVLSAAYAFGGEADLAIQQAQTALRTQPTRFLECHLAHHRRLGASQRRKARRSSRVRATSHRLEPSFCRRTRSTCGGLCPSRTNGRRGGQS